jgi:Mrp family chromosome partitioning ATPase
LAAEVIAYHQPDHAVSQQYRELLGTILDGVGKDCGRALLFTAVTPGAGTTTAVLNLAVCAATDRRQVVVVDANLQRPALARRLGLAPGPGLQEVLAGTAALEQVVQQTAQEHLFALPAGAGGRVALLGGVAGEWVLRWLRERYDVVLLDGSPWQAEGGLADLAARVDAVYLVLDDDQTNQPAVRAATRGLARLGARLSGLIVTR